MMLAALINGVTASEATDALSIEDRGVQYGDGVFETAALIRGNVRYLDSHLARLAAGCRRLGITAPDPNSLISDLDQLCRGHDDGVVKITVTRGAGGRGYRPADDLIPTRIVALYPLANVTMPADSGLNVRWCTTRLARQPQLAGIKHLNRLEQVLAQGEWNDATIDEGLMLDTEGEVISATSSNLFLVIDGVLVTPDLRYSGVMGVMRSRVLEMARTLEWQAEERPVWPQEIEDASEIFLTNAVRGVRPVARLEKRRWDTGPMTRGIANALELW